MIPYLLNIQEFNPIGDNANEIFFQFEKMMKAKQQEMGWDDEVIKNTVAEVKDKLWPTLLGATAEAGVYGLSCLLLILGAACQVRALMLPYMILQMIVLIVFMLIGIGCTVVAFFFNVIVGTFLHSTNSTSKMISRKNFQHFFRSCGRWSRLHLEHPLDLFLDCYSKSLHRAWQQRLHVQSGSRQTHLQRRPRRLLSDISSAFPNGRTEVKLSAQVLTQKEIDDL